MPATIQRSRDGITIGFNMIKAPVPARVYVADVASVRLANQTYHLIFGQTKVTGDDVRSLIDIHMPEAGVVSFLKSAKEIRTAPRQPGIHMQPLRTFREEPAQATSLPANLSATSISGPEACWDFYHSSTFVMAEIVAGSTDLRADPVVRVVMPTSVLLAVIDELMTLVSRGPMARELVEEGSHV